MGMIRKVAGVLRPLSSEGSILCLLRYSFVSATIRCCAEDGMYLTGSWTFTAMYIGFAGDERGREKTEVWSRFLRQELLPPGSMSPTWGACLPPGEPVSHLGSLCRGSGRSDGLCSTQLCLCPNTGAISALSFWQFSPFSWTLLFLKMSGTNSLKCLTF